LEVFQQWLLIQNQNNFCSKLILIEFICYMRKQLN
jgi:hypothetical protein